MSHFCQYHPVDKTGGKNMYHILEGNDLQFYIFVRLCSVISGSLARCLFLSPWLKSRRASDEKPQISFKGTMSTMIGYPKRKNIK